MKPLIPLLLACHPPSAEPRVPGVRAPLHADCASDDDIDCMLPWPNSRLMAVDDSTPTGLRVSVPASALPVEDDPASLNVADGYSTLSGLAVGFAARVDAGTLDGALRLLVAEPADPQYGQDIPLRLELHTGGSEISPADMVFGRPERPMPHDAAHVAVVLDTLRAADGAPLPASRDTRVALGLEIPRTTDEVALAAYHGPTRALLQEAGIDPATVIRVWDFVTRSEGDPRRRLEALVAADGQALAAGQVAVVVDEVEIAPRAEIAAIVVGHLTGLLEPRGEDDTFWLEDGALPQTGQTRDAPFRVVIPAGEGDYPIAIYGHGTAGNVYDDAFDVESAAAGVAKVGLEWQGWTDATVFNTFGRITNHVLEGSAASTAGLVVSAANAITLRAALSGVLGDALSAGELGGYANPAAGRRPDTHEPLYMGGSLGGTMGAVVSLADPQIRYAVLNVPGAGWTHFIPPSSTFTMLSGLFASVYGDESTAQLALLASQTAWDDADGGAWAAARQDDEMFLLQESIGDPVLPNVGSALLAQSLEASQFSPAIDPIGGLAATEGPVTAGCALQQFEVPQDQDELSIHGFADQDSAAADAAMTQIFAFFMSALDGAPTIAVPPSCTGEHAACDWSAGW